MKRRRKAAWNLAAAVKDMNHYEAEALARLIGAPYAHCINWDTMPYWTSTKETKMESYNEGYADGYRVREKDNLRVASDAYGRGYEEGKKVYAVHFPGIPLKQGSTITFNQTLKDGEPVVYTAKEYNDAVDAAATAAYADGRATGRTEQKEHFNNCDYVTSESAARRASVSYDRGYVDGARDQRAKQNSTYAEARIFHMTEAGWFNEGTVPLLGALKSDYAEKVLEQWTEGRLKDNCIGRFLVVGGCIAAEFEITEPSSRLTITRVK